VTGVIATRRTLLARTTAAVIVGGGWLTGTDATVTWTVTAASNRNRSHRRVYRREPGTSIVAVMCCPVAET
jgi:hypothetical protein